MVKDLKYKSPLSIYFVWHPNDSQEVKPLIDYCTALLKRDVNNPFSRNMNIPVFYRTTIGKGVPVEIQDLSNKTLVFAFIGMEIAPDESWVRYLRGMIKPSSKSIRVLPIALDQYAFELNDLFKGINYIRMKDFGALNMKSRLSIALMHEIFRFALNDHFEEYSEGRRNAIRFFISHSKKDKLAVGLAGDIKEYIDHTPMNRFLDVVDISPGYGISAEIEKHIQKSTVISIHSDSYSSRYWCQREILFAKEHDCPIIGVNVLETYEDRRFPFATNYPAISAPALSNLSEIHLLKIVEAALIESLRYYYSKLMLKAYRRCGWFGHGDIVISRPPEFLDVSKLLVKRIKKQQNRRLIYPEPPVYNEELTYLKDFEISACTPLTVGTWDLSKRSVGISISDPNEEELVRIGQDENHLVHLSQDIARHLLARKARIVYGGDLRQNGFTENIIEEARILKDRMKTDVFKIENYIAWPFYIKDTKELKMWKAGNSSLAKMIHVPPPKDVQPLKRYIEPNNKRNSYIWSRCLTKMREEMIGKCSFRICAGGRLAGYKGKIPGVLEEILIALRLRKPIYLLGGFGGVVERVCQMIQAGHIPAELTKEWQIQNNLGYEELLEYIGANNKKYVVDYDSIHSAIKDIQLRNGLTREENKQLMRTPFVDEALHLILKGMENIQRSRK